MSEVSMKSRTILNLTVAASLGMLGANVYASDAPLPAGYDHYVANMRFQQKGWTFHPTYQYQDGTAVVDSVLAIADPGSTVGDNLTAVWYVRTSSGWDKKSWYGATALDAVRTVKEDLRIPDFLDSRWNLDELNGAPGQGWALQSEPYDKGLLVSDPLYDPDLLEAQHDQIVPTLKELGWPVADISAESAAHASCNDTSDINGIAAATEYQLSTGTLDLLAVGMAYADEVAATCGGSFTSSDNMVIGGSGYWWTLPTEQHLGDPVNLGCFTDNDGQEKCLWSVPGNWTQHRVCLTALPDGQQGPPNTCFQSRDLNNGCNVTFVCPKAADTISTPPCTLKGDIVCNEPLGSIPWHDDAGNDGHNCNLCPVINN